MPKKKKFKKRRVVPVLEIYKPIPNVYKELLAASLVPIAVYKVAPIVRALLQT